MTLRQLLTLRGRIERAPFLITGALLLLVKFGLDSFVAAHFGHSWSITNYFLPPRDVTMFTLAGGTRDLYLTLWGVAIPFFWVGVSLTLARLRDAGLHAAWIVLFFVPILNLLFFVLLSAAPGRAEPLPLGVVGEAARVEAAHVRFAPAIGIAVATILGLGLVLFSTHVLVLYAWGLFLGVPVAIGFITSWFLNASVLHTRSQTAVACLVSCILTGFGLLSFRLEGAGCLLMALPLAVPFAIAGGLMARSMLERRYTLPRLGGMATCVAILPLLLLGEQAANVQPPIRPVVTSIVVNAPVHTVWQNVIAFPPLAPPQELIFHSGIAFPIGATISGSGVGAIRRCRFSTGDFVEPITTWDTDHLLAFSVTSQPPAMQEIGFGPVRTPHIDRNYMRSQHGQFRLVALDDRHTLLEGTTWYQDYFWPQVYWRGWSDFIVHRIHTRVLEHVKAQAEAQVRQ